MDLDGDRIRCVDPVVIADDFENQVRAISSYEAQERHEGLFIHAGSKRYRGRPLYNDAVVMGVFTDTKRWMDKKEQLGSLLVGVSKETNRGRAIVPIGAVGGGWTDEGVKRYTVKFLVSALESLGSMPISFHLQGLLSDTPTLCLLSRR